MFQKFVTKNVRPVALGLSRNSGGCNGCDIEVLNVLTPYYDVERFGIKLVGSPRHADVMLCQGPAVRSTATALKRAYEAMPAPKLVFAIGSCACGGGIWFDTYSVSARWRRVVPVNYYIPGCPPRPEAIIYGVAVALGLVTRKRLPSNLKSSSCPFHATTPRIYVATRAWSCTPNQRKFDN